MTAKPIPRSVLALLRHRWRTNDDGYSAFDSVFHGAPIEPPPADRPPHPWEDPAVLSQYRRERQLDPSYYNFAAYMDGVDPDHPFSSAEAAALLRDGVFEDVSEDQGSRIMVNEHAVHALDDFCCEVYTAWAKYLDRLALARRACPIEQSKAIWERDLAARRASTDAQ